VGPAELRDQLQGALGDAYRVQEEILGGGMSRIFRAEELALGREVAVKVLPPEMVAGVSLERFRLEILHAARYHHPNIIPVLTVGTLRGHQGSSLPYYTMPFVRGESLRTAIDREGRLPPALAVRILRSIADALALAHDHGIVHRDIKPGNVLLAGGHALVTDFGISKALTRPSPTDAWITMPGTVVGTPAYMAPEQAAGDPNADHRVDIYALGVVGYEMLTGRLPFTSDQPHEIVAAHMSQPPEPLDRSNPELPLPLSRIVMRCLAKSPSDRWQSARELVEAFDALSFSGTQAVSAPRPTRWTRIRVPVLAAGALAAVLGSVAIARAIGLGHDAIRSLAVLPMEIVGDSTSMLVFARGVQEELNHELQQIPGLSLALAPPDVMITGVSRRQIGEALGVEHLITSSIRPFADGYRVEVQLVRVAGDQLRWSERFDVRRIQVDEEQERVARLVSERLLATDTVTGLTHLKRSNVPAAELAYIRGKAGMNRRTRTGVAAAIAEFEQAIRLDPSHTRALTDLSSAYALYMWYGYRGDLSSYAMAARSLALAERAIALGPDNGDAYVARMYVSNLTYAPLDSVRRDYEAAERLRPSSPNVLTWRASMLMREGKMAEAMAMAERALQTDPLSPPRRVSLAINALGARRYDLALDQARRAETLEATLAITRALQGWSYLLLGQPDRCATLDLGPYQGTRAACLAALGRLTEAARVADSLENALNHHTLDPAYAEALAAQELAIYSAWLKRPADATRWLERAFELSPTGVDPRLIRSGLFDEMLRDSGFAARVQSLPDQAWTRVLHDSHEAQ
jgi:TolB-like protein/tetratricopeptide (TPR) repeat protein